MRTCIRPACRSFLFLVFAVALPGCRAPGPAITQVSDTSAGAFEASLATYPDGFVAAWYDTRDGHGEIYIRRLDADGVPTGPEHRLTHGDVHAYEADVQPLGKDLLVGWYEKAADGRLTPWFGVWTRDGERRWSKPLASAGRNTVVRAAGELVFTAWIVDEGDDRAGVWGAWWRAKGTPLIAPRRLADAGRTTWNVNAAIDPSASPGRPRAWVAFDAKAGTASEELFLVDTSEATDRVVQITPDDGAASKYPDLAFAGDRVALTWFDVKDGNEEVYLVVGETSTLGMGQLPAPVRVTTTPGHSIGAYLAWNDDRLGLSWCDDTVGQHEIFFQTFDRGGRPEQDAIRVTDTPTRSLIPAIEPWNNGFALLWGEYDPPPEGVHAEGGRSQVMFTLRR